MLLTNTLQTIVSNNSGLLIITTFPNLVYDIEQLTCSGDKVLSLIPLGVDPHDYVLKPSDIDLVMKSNLLVSTQHTHFEIELNELISKGVVNTEYIDLLKTPGLVLKNNPLTNTVNYHTPIYDPLNYILFIKYISTKLESLNPKCAEIYRNKSSVVINRVLDIYFKTPRLNKTVIIDYPYIQYAIEWIGFKIINIVVKEHGLETTPDLGSIEKIIVNKQVDYIAVTEPVISKHSIWLYRKAVENNISVLKIYTPLFNNSIVDKLNYIYNQIVSQFNQTIIEESGNASINVTVNKSSLDYLETTTYLFGLVLITVTIYFVIKRDIFD